MRVIDKLVAAAGIDPREGPAEKAALLVRRLALRVGEAHSSTLEENVARGWSDLEGCAALFEEIVGSSRRAGSAFGRPWPWFEVGTSLVAPGLPVRMSPSTEEEGPDGVYTRHEGGVDRESVGRRDQFLDCGERTPGERTETDFLLWFSSTVRFLLADGMLEIEDLFSRTRYAPSRQFIERELVRTKRVDPGVLEGIDCGREYEGPTIEISRPTGRGPGTFADPEAFLEGRLDVEAVERRENEIVLRDLRSERSVLEIVHSESRRWSLLKREGPFPLEGLEISWGDRGVDLSARLPPGVRIETPGVRERWVFDLHADLGAALDSPGRTQNE